MSWGWLKIKCKEMKETFKSRLRAICFQYTAVQRIRGLSLRWHQKLPLYAAPTTEYRRNSHKRIRRAQWRSSRVEHYILYHVWIVTYRDDGFVSHLIGNQPLWTATQLPSYYSPTSLFLHISFKRYMEWLKRYFLSLSQLNFAENCMSNL